MKTKFFFKIALVLLLAISMTNCTKDTVIEEQNPFLGYLTATGFNQDTSQFVNTLVDYEFGLSFKPMVDGKMTAIIAKIPSTQLNVRVTIWDVATTTILRTELMDIASSGVEVTKVISPLTLEKNKEYMISFNTNDYYVRRKTDFSAVTYPFTVGDLSITNYSYANGTTQQMPNVVSLTYYTGDMTFKFQKS